MSDATFTLTYDGPALADHTMDVADLAPALVALSQYMKATSRLLNGDKMEVVLRAKAVEPGCFQIVLHVDGKWIEHVTDFLAGKGVTAVANVVGIATASIAAVAYLSKRKIKAVRPSTPENVVVLLDDGTELEFPEAVVRVVRDPKARAAMEGFVADPLDKEGIERMSVSGSPVPVSITSDQADAFRAPIGEEDTLLTTTSRMVFSIASLSFQPGNKWRLSTGKGAPISVTMADEAFIARVQNSEIAFAKGDYLICDVQTQSREANSKLVTDYTIQKVVEHRSAQKPDKGFDFGSEVDLP